MFASRIKSIGLTGTHHGMTTNQRIAVVEWLVLDLFGNRFFSTKNLYGIQRIIADWLDEGLNEEDIEIVPWGATISW